MNQTEDAERKQQTKKFFPGGFWWITLAAIILSLVVVRLSRVFTEETQKYAFIAQAILNILIFAAILVQALIYRRQWDAMNESTRLARDALYLSERPYVVASKPDVTNLPFEAGKLIKYETTIGNKGSTPAYNLEFSMYIDVEPYRLPENPNYRSVRTSLSNVALAMEDTMTSRQTDINDVLTQQQVDDINDGNLFVYIYGFVRYEEQFTNKVHRTRFYVIYDPDEKRFIRGSHHNDMT